MIIPLQEQIKEQAERRQKEQEFLNRQKEADSTIWGQNAERLYDIDSVEQRQEKRREALQKVLENEARNEGRKVEQLKDEDYIDVDGEIDRKQRSKDMQTSVDKLPIKQKKRWRLW